MAQVPFVGWDVDPIAFYQARAMRAYAARFEATLKSSMLAANPPTIFVNLLPQEPTPMTKPEFSNHLTALIADAADADLAKRNLVLATKALQAERVIAVKALADGDTARARADNALRAEAIALREIERLRGVVRSLYVDKERLESAVASRDNLLRRVSTPSYYTMYPR